MHGRRGERPDCASCVPPLWPENREAAQVYMMCRGQLVFAGMGQPVDINHMAVHAAMDLYEVRDRQDCFEKAVMLAGEFLAEAGDG